MTSLGWMWCVLLASGAALATAALISVSAKWLRRYALARPNARSSHAEPTPQGAGAPVVLVTAAASVTTFVCLGLPIGPLLIVVLSALALAFVGAIDDIKVLQPTPRLVVQIAAATAVVVALPEDLRLLGPLPVLVEQVVLTLAIVWFVNLVNFMDGIDWITVAEVVPITATLVLLGALETVPMTVPIVALALGGSILGFAPFNRPVARLFLGDVGSLPIGLVLTWLLILTAGSDHLVTALLAPLYYLADATLTLGSRLTRRERVWQAHRSHYYQRATTNGFTVLEVVARIWMVNLALGALAIVAALAGRGIEVGCLAGGVILVAWLLRTFSRGPR